MKTSSAILEQQATPREAAGAVVSNGLETSSPDQRSVAWGPLLLCAYLATIPIMDGLWLQWLRFPVILADLIFVGLFLVTIGRRLWQRSQPLLKDPFCLLLLLHWTTALVSVLCSIDPLISLRKLIAQTYLTCIALVVSETVGQCRDKALPLKAWAIGIALTIAGGMFGVAQFYLSGQTFRDSFLLSHYGSVPSGNYPRINSFFLNANMLCDYLVASYWVVVALMFGRRITPLMGCGLLAGILLCGTFSMSPCLGALFLSLGVSTWWLGSQYAQFRLLRWSLPVCLTLSAGLLFLVCIPPHWMSAAMGSVTKDGGVSLSPRVMAWGETLQTFSHRPVFGQGLGTETAAVRYPRADGSIAVVTDPHNIWLSILGQSGLAGGLAFAAIIVLVMSRAWSVPLTTSSPFSVPRALMTGMAMCLFYCGISDSIEDNRHQWILIGYVAALSKLMNDAPGQPWGNAHGISPPDVAEPA